MIDHRLRTLGVLAAVGTVTAAARTLGYTPSAVSAQLRALSEQLGVTLVVPDGRRLQLTAAGQTLVARSNDLYNMWELIEAEVIRSAGEPDGALRLCGFSTAAAALLPVAAARLRAAHPGIALQLTEASPEGCIELLVAEQADLAVVVATTALPPRTDQRFEQRHLMDDPLDLLLPNDHPLATRRSVALHEAATEHWIADHDGSAYHQLLLTACTTAGFAPDIRHRAMEWESMAALVDAGFGCALAPRMTRLPAGHRLVRVPLGGEPQPARSILAITRRGREHAPLVAEALDELQREVRSLGFD